MRSSLSLTPVHEVNHLQNVGLPNVVLLYQSTTPTLFQPSWLVAFYPGPCDGHPACSQHSRSWSEEEDFAAGTGPRFISQCRRGQSQCVCVFIDTFWSIKKEELCCKPDVFFSPCSWWLFWKRRWSRQTTSQNMKTLISTGSCWCALSTLAVCVSLTWRPTSFLWWAIHHC